MLVVYLSHVIEHNVQIYIFIAAMFGPITILWITLETAIPVAIFTPLFYDFFTKGALALPVHHTHHHLLIIFSASLTEPRLPILLLAVMVGILLCLAEITALEMPIG